MGEIKMLHANIAHYTSRWITCGILLFRIDSYVLQEKTTEFFLII